MSLELYTLRLKAYLARKKTRAQPRKPIFGVARVPAPAPAYFQPGETEEFKLITAPPQGLPPPGIDDAPLTDEEEAIVARIFGQKPQGDGFP